MPVSESEKDEEIRQLGLVDLHDQATLVQRALFGPCQVKITSAVLQS